MPEPRSAFFFSGRLDPPELANFNIQNVFLRDRRGAVLELLGHGIAIWWPSRPRSHNRELRESAEAWFQAIAGAYFLHGGTALEPRLVGWVEALDVEVKEAVVGLPDRRFEKVKPVEPDDPRNDEMRSSILVSRRLRGSGELERAVTELLAAANDSGPESLLHCFRALECIRRIYEPSFEKRKQGWAAMKADLAPTGKLSYELLAEAAEGIRHGDVPLRQSQRDPVNTARRRRDDYIEDARAIIGRAIEKRLGVS